MIVKSLSKKESKHLSDLESTLIKIAKSEQDKKGNFSIEDLMKIAVPARKEPDYTIYYAIYNLYKNQIFKPTTKGESVDNVEELKAKTAEISKEPTAEKKAIISDQKDLLKGLIVPNLKNEEIERLRHEITSMSQTNQKMIIKEIMFTSDDKRTKIVKNMLKEREKSRISLKQNLSELDNLKNKESPPYDEIFQRMEATKKIYENLGDEEKASLLAMDIQDVIGKFDSIKEIKELRLEITNIIKDADLAKNKKDYPKAALLYRKAARIYVEIGDDKQAVKLGEIANSCEQQEK